MRVMAFIPARGGSKGILRKNLVPLAGKPLIQYTVEAARTASAVTEIFLSSDDPEIIDFCRGLGLDVEYVRPKELASDTAPMVDAVLDGLRFVEERDGRRPDAVMLLQPTSPLRRAEDIDAAVELFADRGVKSVVSVHEVVEHPYECVRTDGKGWKFLARPERPAYRRQDYAERFYYINGAVYLVDSEHLRETRAFVHEDETALYFMDARHGIDIDEPFDLERAELYLRVLKGEA